MRPGGRVAFPPTLPGRLTAPPAAARVVGPVFERPNERRGQVKMAKKGLLKLVNDCSILHSDPFTASTYSCKHADHCLRPGML
jgi:hypothetical protein